MRRNIERYIKSNKLTYKVVEFLLKIRGRRVTHGKTSINILQSFPMYEVHGWGLYPIRAKLTIQSINQTIPALSNFTHQAEKNKIFESEMSNILTKDDNKNALMLKKIIHYYGSDKSTNHDYYKIYSTIFEQIGEAQKIFEIGLGTNNIDVVSTMGRNGKPGASLRAFRDHLPNCQVFGADFDKRVLFSEERIETYFVDQTKKETFQDLHRIIGDNFDLMIDDGLHSPNANLNSLDFFIRNIKVGGFAVIEDINVLTKPIWGIVGHLIEANYLSAFIQTKASCMFIVKRER